MTQASMLKPKNRKNIASQNLNRDDVQKILGNVVYDRAFFFFEDIGRPTGDVAVSLSDFCGKINTIPSKSLVFHLKRGDFENWIQKIIGDVELSGQVRKLKARKTLWKNDASIRTKLHATVRERITELQDLWQESLKRPASNIDQTI